MRLRLIACNVFQREACHVLARTPHVVDVVFVDLGEHNRPTVLRERLQAEIDATATAPHPYDAVLLLFGLCGNAAVGLQAKGAPLIMPRAHDCATVLLGGKEAFRRQFEAQPSHAFGNAGYCERGYDYMISRPAGDAVYTGEYADYVERYGEEDAKYIWEQMHPAAADSDEAWYIRVPESDGPGFAARFQQLAEAAGRTYVELSGSLRLIESLLLGEWPDTDFLRVEPGHETVGVYDWDTVVKSA